MNTLSFTDLIPLITDQSHLISTGPSEAVYKSSGGKTCFASVHHELTNKIADNWESPSSFVVVEQTIDHYKYFRLFFHSMSDANRLHSLYMIRLENANQFTVHRDQYQYIDHNFVKILPWSGYDQPWVNEIEDRFKMLLVELPIFRLHWLTGGLEI